MIAHVSLPPHSITTDSTISEMTWSMQLEHARSVPSHLDWAQVVRVVHVSRMWDMTYRIPLVPLASV